MPKQEDIDFIEKNINNPDKTEDILRLVIEQKIDPNEYLLYGMNLFHLSLSTPNINLARALCQQNLVDINKKTNNGTPPLMLVIQMYSSKLEASINFLLDETKIDITATNSVDFTAAGWAERIKQFSLMHKLLKLEDSHSIGNMIYQTKMTCLRFSLKKSSRNEGLFFKQGNFPIESMDPEGYDCPATVPSLYSSFDGFVKQRLSTEIDSIESKILSETNIVLQNNTMMYDKNSDKLVDLTKQILKKYQDGEMIIIHSTAQEHAASFVMKGDTFYRCNKGLEKDENYSIVEFKIDPNDINEHNLYYFMTTLSPQKNLDSKQVDGIKGKSQHSGNCTVASPKKSIETVIYDLVKKYCPQLSKEHQKILAKELYKKWCDWDRNQQIDKLLASCENNPEVFVQILKNILLDSARFSANHLHLAKALYQAIPRDIFNAEFKNLTLNFSTFIEDISKTALLGEELSFGEKIKAYTEFLALLNISFCSKDYELIMASCSGDSDKIINLSQKNHDYLLSTNGERKLSCAHLAIMWNNLNCLKSLIQLQPNFINQTDVNNFSPLHMALFRGNPVMVKFLLESGADIAMRAGKNKQISCEDLINSIKNSNAQEIRQLLSQYEKNKMVLRC